MILVLCIMLIIFVVMNAIFNLYWINVNHKDLMEQLLDMEVAIDNLHFTKEVVIRHDDRKID